MYALWFSSEQKPNNSSLISDGGRVSYIIGVSTLASETQFTHNLPDEMIDHPSILKILNQELRSVYAFEVSWTIRLEFLNDKKTPFNAICQDRDYDILFAETANWKVR